MDTNIGVISITEKQKSRLSDLHSEVIRGFTCWNDDNRVVVTSTRGLTEQEIADLKASIAELPDTYSQKYYREVFDIVLFQTDLATILPSLSNPLGLRNDVAAINIYATNKDFEGMVGYMEMLVNAGVATSNDLNSVKSAVTAQGIVL